jgi:hypothetical protein
LSTSVVMWRLIAGVKRGRHWHPVVHLGHQSTTKPSDPVSMIISLCCYPRISLVTCKNSTSACPVACRLLSSMRSDFWPLIGNRTAYATRTGSISGPHCSTSAVSGWLRPPPA